MIRTKLMEIYFLAI